MEAKNQQTEPQGPTKYENHAKMGAPSVTIESQGRPKCKKSTKKSGNKGRHESANKQTNEQTLPYTITQTKPLTKRPLDH